MSFIDVFKTNLYLKQTDSELGGTEKRQPPDLNLTANNKDEDKVHMEEGFWSKKSKEAMMLLYFHLIFMAQKIDREARKGWNDEEKIKSAKMLDDASKVTMKITNMMVKKDMLVPERERGMSDFQAHNPHVTKGVKTYELNQNLQKLVKSLDNYEYDPNDPEGVESWALGVCDIFDNFATVLPDNNPYFKIFKHYLTLPKTLVTYFISLYQKRDSEIYEFMGNGEGAVSGEWKGALSRFYNAISSWKPGLAAYMIKIKDHASLGNINIMKLSKKGGLICLINEIEYDMELSIENRNEWQDIIIKEINLSS